MSTARFEPEYSPHTPSKMLKRRTGHSRPIPGHFTKNAQPNPQNIAPEAFQTPPRVVYNPAMAIVKFGTSVVGIRGTLGGIVYSANSSGPHARIWSKGANPKSPRQSAIRGDISALGSLWAALTPAARATWTAFGLAPPEVDTNSLGELIYLSGWMWFVRVNQRRQAVGLATTSTLPTNSAVAAPATCTLTATALPGGAVTVGWTAGTFPAGYSATLELGTHPTAGLVAKTSGLMQIWTAQAPAGTSANISSYILARFGNLPAGWKLFASLYVLRDDGVRSTSTSTTAMVT